MSAFALDAAYADTCSKVMLTELAQNMLHALATHEHMNSHVLFTGDESWMFSAFDYRMRWIVSWDVLMKLSDRHISARKLCSRSSSMTHRNPNLRFFQRDKKWIIHTS
jgi:hypothetical protein